MKERGIKEKNDSIELKKGQIGKENYDIQLSDREKLIAKEDKQIAKDKAEHTKTVRMIENG